MEGALIIRDDHKLTISFTPAALELKESALGLAALINRVSSAEENANAVEAQKELKRILHLCETARKQCKEPVLDFGRTIDASAKQFAEAIETEFHRVTKLVADFQALELAKQRAAEAARRLEEEKLQRERDAEQYQIRMAADQALVALCQEEEKAAKAASEARNAKERAEAASLQHELERQKQLAEAKTHEQLEATQERFNQAAQALPVYIAPKVKGQTVSDEWECTVTDIHLLYRHHPNCVSMTPLLSEIKALVKAGTIPKGVRAEKVVKSGVRVGPERKAIEV